MYISKKMKKISTLLILGFLSFDINAQNLSGTWGYKINGNYITLYGDKIQNQNNSGTTGTLKVAIWATKYPYNGGTINGYKLYEYTLDPLDAGYVYNDVSQTGWCTMPPSGSYSLSILLLEYDNPYYIVDYLTIDGYTRF